MIEITIDEEACKGCPECTSVCPVDVFQLDEPGKPPKTIAAEKCFGCFSCVDVCRADAIEIKGFPVSTSYFLELEDERVIRGLLEKLI